jgi:predicted membrane channel-forming protein YqfA (hemolysin III family)
MALSYKTRRRLSLLILAVGMPFYVVVAVTVVNLFDRPAVWLELVIYVVLGILWVLPFRSVFRGIGQADPDAKGAPQEPTRGDTGA